MSDTTAETSKAEPGTGSEIVTQFLANAVLLLKLVAAGTQGIERCFLKEVTSATIQSVSTLAESSTELRKLAPEIRLKLDAMLEAARHSIIEDGMCNPVNEQLRELVEKDFRTVIPALWSAIEAERTTPIVAAEVLKELGHLRNVTSHATRKWVLERALRSPWPFTRDGAGLGLARLGDPSVIPSLQRAVEREPNAQIKADLQLVIDELAGMFR